MVNALFFIGKKPVELIQIPAGTEWMTYVREKGNALKLPVRVAMFTLPNGNVAAIHVASDRYVSSAEALAAYLKLVAYQL
ncbi:hypothetical protein [Atlantibacter hermannii]|uniref:hypothetical protein n=1 Tax=Atlantibacter hermannii TaxID=565 RepID=UPI00289A504F|nr:hypothetical protein [Atlantibacter hermannii]